MERSDAGARLAVQPLGGKGEVVRIEQLVLRLHGAEVVVHVHKDDDGILQPLRGVHGEHLDGVFAAALAELHLVFPRLEGEQEGVHRARSRLGKVQHAAKAQLSLLLGEDLRLQTVREQQADHLARGAHPSEKAVAGGKLEECLQAQGKFVTQLFRIRAAGGAEGGRQRKAAAHGGKIALRKAAQKGEHRPRHRDVLLGIVEIGQPAEDELGLPEVAHVDLCRGGDGDAHFAQAPHDALRRARTGAREDGDVAVSDGAFALFVGIEPRAAEFPLHERRNALGEGIMLLVPEGGEHGIHAALLRLPLLAFGQEDAAHLSPMFPVPPAALHHGLGGVVEPARLLGHRMGEHLVDRFDDGRRRAEALTQAQRDGEGARLLEEIPGTAAAEGVDGLLGIAHEEHLLPAHETEELLLHEVDILILIHEHIAVAAAHRLAHLLVAQHAEGALLEVVVVEEARLALETAEAFAIVEDERGKRTGARGCLFMTDALCLRVDAAQRLYDLLEGGRDCAQAEDARELFPHRLGLGRSGRDLPHPLCEADGLPEAFLGKEGPHLLREHGAQPFARFVSLKRGGELLKPGIERGDLSAVSLQDRRSDPLEGDVARLGKALFGIAHRAHLRIHRTDGAAQ